MEKLVQKPRLFLTSMSSGPSAENIIEMIEPLIDVLDGVIWVLHDTHTDSPAARYLETVKGAGRVIHRRWPAGRHFHSMNETLFTGLIEEGDFVCWTDEMERPAASFLKRVKSEIGPMMVESGTDVLFYFGKPYLFRYYETLQYHNSPHWSLHGYPGRAIEWANIQPNEREVRLNVRPEKRKNDPFHWVGHYAKYFVSYPAGSNTVALGLDHFPPGDRNEQFAIREQRRLEFRRLMKKRGFPLNNEGLKTLLSQPPDTEVRGFLAAEKILSDYYHHVILGDNTVVDSHDPSRAKPIP